MLNKMLVIAGVTIALAGCADAPVQRPRFGAYTTLTIPVFSEKWERGNVQLATKQKNGCGAFAANILPDAYDKDFTLDIEGNRDMFFHVARLDAQTECDKFGIFYASKGKEYRLSVAAVNGACAVSLTETSADGSVNTINTYPAHASRVDGIKVCLDKGKLY